MLDNIRKYNILLASKSPRRKELLSELRIPFTVVSRGGIDESYPEDLDVDKVAEYLSKKKAKAYLKIIDADHDMVITADTVVVCDNHIFGKPHDGEEAVKMLMTLSGKWHKVITGVSISTREKCVSFSTVTNVKFAEITEEEAHFYVSNYQPLDKAGAYGIQEWIGCIAVEKIEGSFYNVMGLPVHQLYRELKRF